VVPVAKFPCNSRVVSTVTDTAKRGDSDGSGAAGAIAESAKPAVNKTACDGYSVSLISHLGSTG
jgi:hypothetical protein